MVRVMKTLLTFTDTQIVIHHKGIDHSYRRTGGTVLLTEEEAGNLPEPLALILILLAGARKFYIEKSAYRAVRERVWTLLDRKAGGLNPIGIDCYSKDEGVFEAAELNRAAVGDMIGAKSKPAK